MDSTQKIHIVSEFRTTPWGGGNQFLKALRQYLRSQFVYTDNIHQADIVIVNGHHWGGHLWILFYHLITRKNLVLIHRVDGPMEVVRNSADNRIVDEAISKFNRYFATGTIFQSYWSQSLCKAHGLDSTKPCIVIYNAPDPAIFYPKKLEKYCNTKIRVIATSWSSNWRKGFDIFQHIDKHLDFSRYEFTFIGNSPITFENICHIQPLSSNELAVELRKHQIFLQASHLEACSNSLIEAMNCGLVPVARNNSSHPEIVNEAGVLYEGIEDVIAAIETAAKGCATYLAKIPQTITMECSGRAYLNFAKELSRASVTRPSLSEFFVTWASWKLAHRPAIFLWLQTKVRKLRHR